MRGGFFWPTYVRRSDVPVSAGSGRYNILIDYKNLQAGFFDSDAWVTLSALSYDPVLEYPWAINTFL